MNTPVSSGQLSTDGDSSVSAIAAQGKDRIYRHLDVINETSAVAGEISWDGGDSWVPIATGPSSRSHDNLAIQDKEILIRRISGGSDLTNVKVTIY